MITKVLYVFDLVLENLENKLIDFCSVDQSKRLSDPIHREVIYNVKLWVENGVNSNPCSQITTISVAFESVQQPRSWNTEAWKVIPFGIPGIEGIRSILSDIPLIVRFEWCLPSLHLPMFSILVTQSLRIIESLFEHWMDYPQIVLPSSAISLKTLGKIDQSFVPHKCKYK
jgi:hypothetical protein